MSQYIFIFWAAFGVIAILLEAMAVPGIGFLFAGLAAFSVGILLQFDVLAQDDYIWQLICFMAFTTGWLALLWLPLKRIQMRNSSDRYLNIEGDTVVVKTIPKHHQEIFTALWSGTVVNAQLENDCKTDLSKGDTLKITTVKGNVFVVRPL